MCQVTAPKDLARLARSTKRALAKLEVSATRLDNCPRWHVDPDLVKKYNLIEFL